MSDSSAPDNKKPTPEARAAPRDRPRKRSFAPIFSALAILIALLALAGSAYLWREYRTLDSSRTTAAAALQKTQQQAQALAALQQQLAQLRNAAATQADINRVERHASNTVDELKQQLAGVNEALARLRRQIGSGQTAARLDDAAYLARIAQHQAQIVRDPVATVAALTAVDSELAGINRPGVDAVRGQVADALAQLNNAPRADSSALARQLASLAERVESLPLKRLQGTPEPASKPAPPATWWQRLGNGLARAFHELVTVRRSNGTSAPLLAPRERYFLYANLTLQFDAARLAALQRDEANFQASLKRAQDWLNKYFDANAAAVKAVEGQLTAMQKARLDVTLPDLAPLVQAIEQLQQPKGGAQ